MVTVKEILDRRSVRSYSNKIVEREKIEACIEAASIGPSACNKQPWYFIAVDDPVLKEKLCKAAFDFPPKFNKFTLEAPAMIVVCAEEDFLTHKVFGGIKNIQYYLLDIGAAVENFILQAVNLGLGTCWLGWFNEKAIKKLLNIPGKIRIVSLISLGYPNEKKDQVRKRKQLKDIYSYNKFT